MLQLSINEQPALDSLKAAAATMFAGIAARGAGGQLQSKVEPSGLLTVSEVDKQQQKQQGQSGGLLGSRVSNSGASAAKGRVTGASAGGAGGLGPATAVVPAVGQLGPLGNYLLARWREDATRSATAAAQQSRG